MKFIILVLSFVSLVLGTPECYDFTNSTSVTKKLDSIEGFYKDKTLNFISLKNNSNCGFYTYSDVYFASLHPNVNGIYMKYIKQQANSTSCTLESTNLFTLDSGSWLFLNASSNLCGFYVGIANSDS